MSDVRHVRNLKWPLIPAFGLQMPSALTLLSHSLQCGRLEVDGVPSGTPSGKIVASGILVNSMETSFLHIEPGNDKHLSWFL